MIIHCFGVIFNVDWFYGDERVLSPLHEKSDLELAVFCAKTKALNSVELLNSI